MKLLHKEEYKCPKCKRVMANCTELMGTDGYYCSHCAKWLVQLNKTKSTRRK